MTRRFCDMLAPQQAGILSADKQFRAFVADRLDLPGPVSPHCAAEYIRRASAVTSRADLIHPDAADKFQQLRTEYDAWRGAIAQPRT